MRYEDLHRLDSIGGFWFRLKLRLSPLRARRPCTNQALYRLPEHLQRDIGLSEPLRYTDWRTLEESHRS